MINIFSYLFYNLSNFIFIFLIPDNFTKLFLINYSISSGIFTFLIFYHFSKKNILTEKKIILLISFFILLSKLINSMILFIWLFTLLLIYSDYFFSQRKNFILNFIFKLTLMISSFLLLKDFLNPIIVIQIKIIIIYFTLISYYLFFKYSPFLSLKINSPIIYNFWTCLIYFFSLFILTLFVPDDYSKIVYISFQILIGFQLKLFDLKIRNIKIENINFDKIFTATSFSYLICLSIYSKIYYLVLFYLIVFLSLKYLKRKYIFRY